MATGATFKTGSPPRARGGPGGGRRRRPRRGLTPACAGRTCWARCWTRTRRAHPRVRGEDMLGPVLDEDEEGSPPRARGGHGRPACTPPAAGLTPACAGRTSPPAGTPSLGPAHPRVRGEDAARTSIHTVLLGSPPRARGGRVGLAGDGEARGLTPACAGRTSPGRCPRPTSGAHPRVRGEDRPHRGLPQRGRGSPPRARGGRGEVRAHRPQRRLTPACAGRTARRPAGRSCGPAHPRVRGEDVPPGGVVGWCPGSPPRARGGRWASDDPPPRHGLTPACAGRTRGSRRGRWCTRAHPRVRGEDHAHHGGGVHRAGSPPRARGGQASHVGVVLGPGLTPACAGRTLNPPTRSGR